MGDVIPLRDYAATRAAIEGDPASPWFQLAPDAGDWDPCHGCPVRGACREVRECQWGGDDDPEPGITLRLAEPPDIVA
jgi:hypothetical protein